METGATSSTQLSSCGFGAHLVVKHVSPPWRCSCVGFALRLYSSRRRVQAGIRSRAPENQIIAWITLRQVAQREDGTRMRNVMDSRLSERPLSADVEAWTREATINARGVFTAEAV